MKMSNVHEILHLPLRWKSVRKFCSHRMRLRNVFGSPKKPDQKAGPKHLPPSFKHRTPVEKDRVPSRCGDFCRWKFAFPFSTRKDPARKPTKFKFNSCKQKECCKQLYSQEKIHGTPTMGLGRELSYWSWKNLGVSFKSRTKAEKVKVSCQSPSCVPAPLGPDLQLLCSCFALFLVWQWWVMMITDDRMSLYVSLCKSSAFWAQPLFHFAETCFDLHCRQPPHSPVGLQAMLQSQQPGPNLMRPCSRIRPLQPLVACLSPSGLPCWA